MPDESGVTAVSFDLIFVDPRRMSGVPCVRDPGSPVTTVAALVAEGTTVDEIIEEHPDLDATDVAKCLRYAALAVQHGVVPHRYPSDGGGPGLFVYSWHDSHARSFGRRAVSARS